MRIRILNSLDISGIKQDKQCINVIPFGVVGGINLKKQLDGSSKDLVELGVFANALGGITFIGCPSDNYGVIKKSVFIFRGGRLTGIGDMNVGDEKISPSFGYKLTDFEGVKIGVAVDKDVFDPECFKSLSLCGMSLLINLYEGFSSKKAQVMCEAMSYCYGINCVHVEMQETLAFNAYGESVHRVQSTKADFELKIEKVFCESRIKRKGAVR